MVDQALEPVIRIAAGPVFDPPAIVATAGGNLVTIWTRDR